jgi:DNA-directed RNA polymerase specialized sigma24 family protein
LEAEDESLAKLVELRYFTGLTIEETAEILGVSPRTTKRNWAYARAWLRREIDAGADLLE